MKIGITFILAIIMGLSATLSWAAEPVKKAPDMLEAQQKLFQSQSQAVRVQDGAIKPSALPECVDTGQPCTVGGTRCCDSTKSCKGKFPNTYCQ